MKFLVVKPPPSLLDPKVHLRVLLLKQLPVFFLMLRDHVLSGMSFNSVTPKNVDLALIFVILEYSYMLFLTTFL